MNAFRRRKFNNNIRQFKNFNNILPVIAIGGVSVYALWRVVKNKIVKPAPSKIANYLHCILSSKDIENDSAKFASRILSHPQTKMSLITLVKSSLKDNEVYQGVQLLFKNLLINTLKEKEVQNLIQKNILLNLQNQKIRNESISFIQYLLSQDKSKEIMSNFLMNVFERDEVKNSFTNLVTESAIKTLKQKETHKKFSEFIYEIWSDPNVRSKVIKKMFNFWWWKRTPKK